MAGGRCGVGGEESEKVTVSMTSRACSFRFWHTIAYVMMQHTAEYVMVATQMQSTSWSQHRAEYVMVTTQS